MKDMYKEIFPFKYIGGGYFRAIGVPKKVKAEMIHGDDVPKYIIDKMEEIKKENAKLIKELNEM